MSNKYALLRDKEFLGEKYLGGRLSALKIAKIVGCTPSAVAKALRCFNIHRRTYSEAQQGRHHTDETKKKIGEAQVGEKNHNYGNPLSEEQKEKISEASIGKKLSEKHKEKIGEAGKGKHDHRGEKNPCWRGGISFEPYCIHFNERFKEYIRDKFGRVCFLCSTTEKENGHRLSVHHVNYNKNCGCDEDTTCQFVPLCRSCNSKVNFNRDYWENRITAKLREKIVGWYV